MQNLNKYLCIGLIGWFVNIGFSQSDTINRSISVPFFSVDYGVNLPASALKERYGFFNTIGANFGYKTAANWQFSIGGQALFGNKVKTLEPIQHILNENALINGSSGGLARYSILMRGLSVNLKVKKIINLSSSNLNSGILLQLGSGYLQHKIRYEDLENQIPQFHGEYLKLIDRLTGGLQISQAVGYQYFSNNQLVNFSAVFEVTEGFTRSLRSYDLNAENPTSSKGRLDLFYSLKFTWILPFYKKASSNEDKYYYD